MGFFPISRLQSLVSFLFSCLRLFVAVLASTFSALFDACRIENSTNYCIAETYIFDATATEEDYRVLLEIVTFTRNIGSDFHTVRKTNAGDFADSRVRLFRSLGGDFDAYTTLERSRENTGWFLMVLNVRVRAIDFDLRVKRVRFRLVN